MHSTGTSELIRPWRYGGTAYDDRLLAMDTPPVQVAVSEQVGDGDLRLAALAPLAGARRVVPVVCQCVAHWQQVVGACREVTVHPTRPSLIMMHSAARATKRSRSKKGGLPSESQWRPHSLSRLGGQRRHHKAVNH
jgi:hypothetical protein